MKLKALKPTENMTANQIRPFIKKKAKPPIAKYLPYLFFNKIKSFLISIEKKYRNKTII